MRRAKGSGQSNLGARHIFHVQGLHGPRRAQHILLCEGSERADSKLDKCMA